MLACGCVELPRSIYRLLGATAKMAWCDLHGETPVDHVMTPREVTIRALGLPLDWSPPDPAEPPF